MSTLSSRLRKSPTRPDPAGAVEIAAQLDRLDLGHVPAEEPVVLSCSAPRESCVRPPRDVFVDAPYRRRRSGRVATLARTWRDAARSPLPSPERGARGAAPTSERAPSPGPTGGRPEAPSSPSAQTPDRQSPVPPSRPGTASSFSSSPIPVGKGFGKAGLGGAKLDAPGLFREDGAPQLPRSRRREADKVRTGAGAGEAPGPNVGLAAGFAGGNQRGPIPYKF